MKKHFSRFLLAAVLISAGFFPVSCSEKQIEDHSGDDIISDEPIFSSNFDKTLAEKNYGNKHSSWPFLDDFDGWINHTGNGAEKITYEGQMISIRTNQSSVGEFSLYDGSGKNNIFFSTAPNFFIIKNIAINSRNLHLTFGAQRYAQGASNQFLKSDFEIRVSQDNETWSQALCYDFLQKDEGGMWRQAVLDFTLPEGVTEISIKFVAKMSSVNRLDDVLLKQGKGGQEVVFGGDETIKLSSIKDVLQAETDHIYKIKGQIIGTHDKGFLVQDETGVILVFKKKHKMKIGSTVEIEGATTTYGSMVQFGETSEIKVLSEGTYKQPEAEMFKATEFEAYMKNPDIRYITYEGLMTSYRDQIYQWHNNVQVEGTEVIGAIMYPSHSLNIKQYENKHIRVTGYAVGANVAKDGKKLINTMALTIQEIQ